MSKHEFKVGDKIVAVSTSGPSRHVPKAIECVVEKVGRVWVYFAGGDGTGHGRFDPATREVDSGPNRSSYRMVWPSLAAYEAHALVNKAWAKFRQEVTQPYAVPAGLTLERIAAATALVFPQEGAVDA